MRTNGTPGVLKPSDSHGTFVAGIIAAERNGNQIVGVAPNSKLINVCDTSSSGEMSFAVYTTISSRWASGINWAWKNGSDIINCSWHIAFASENFSSAIIENAIDSALIRGRNLKGCVVVFSSGNKNDSVNYPANCNDNIIVVGGIEKNGKRWEDASNGSHYGSKLDVVAPCVDIYSTYNGGTSNYGWSPGTSFAAPHVSGVAALILSIRPDLTQNRWLIL